MSSQIRFHLDESVNSEVAMQLQQRGINVTTTVEAGLRTLSDEASVRFYN